MPRNKNFRSSSRKSLPKNVSDAELVENRNNEKFFERTRSDIERHEFEVSMGNNDPKIRFDYTDNVMSLRGDWKSRISVIKLYFPFIVSKNNCKKFEELVSEAFESIFLA